eukprot:1371333-Heterocapsa_arctica.AAC.2
MVQCTCVDLGLWASIASSVYKHGWGLVAEVLPGIAVKGQRAVEVGIAGAALEWDGLLSVDCKLVKHLRDTLHSAGMETGQPIRLAALLKLCFAAKVMKSLQWLGPQLIHYCGTLMDGRLKSLGFDTTPPAIPARVLGKGREPDQDIQEEDLLAPVSTASRDGLRGRVIFGSRSGSAAALAKYYLGGRRWFHGCGDLSVAVDASNVGKIDMLHGVIQAWNTTEYKAMIAPPQVPHDSP